MPTRKWILLSFAALGCIAIIGVGCARHQARIQPPKGPFGPFVSEMQMANEYAKIGNWDAAGPIFKRLEDSYAVAGDQRNMTYARVSRLRSEMEFRDLEVLLNELKDLLGQPLVQGDLALKQRVLETLANISLNFDGVSARPFLEELEIVAAQRKDIHAQSRASGELGVLAFLEGNASEAKWRVSKAISDAFLYDDKGAEIRYLAMMGQGLVSHKRASEGLWFLNRAENIARSTPTAGYPKLAITGKAAALTSLNRYTEAQQVINEGLRYAEDRGYHGFKTDMLAQAASLAIQQHDMNRAIQLYEEAASLAEQIHFNRGLAEVNAALAELHQQAGDLRKAVDHAARSVKAHRDSGEVYVLPRHLAIQARLQVALGQDALAERTYQAAERIVGTMLANAPTPPIKKAVIAAMSEVFTGHFALAVKKGDLTMAYSILEEARGRVAADRLRVTEDQSTRRTPPPQIAAAERKLAGLQLRLLDEENPKERARLADALVAAESEMDAGSAAKLLPPLGAAPRLADLQTSLQPDETVLEYVLGEPSSYVLVIQRKRITVRKIAGRTEIDSFVDRFLRAIEKQELAMTEGQQLFSAVLDLGTSMLTQKLIVVADGSLHRVPFAALTDDRMKFLVEKYTISHTPSGNVLTLLRKAATTKRTALLAVGDVPYGMRPAPLRSWNPFRGTFESMRRKAFTSLPGSADEVRDITTILGVNNGVVLSGRIATEANFKRESQKPFSVVHLAVHAFADKAYPDRAALVFGEDSASGEDGLLQVREIRRLPLSNTSLVTLSACDTNVGRIEGQEGVNSIVSAFLYAGAHSAVASFWKVADSATSDFMRNFYAELLSGKSKAEALRMAQLSFVRRVENTKPIHWAAFHLMGEGANSLERMKDDNSRKN